MKSCIHVNHLLREGWEAVVNMVNIRSQGLRLR
jgi:hypothetical protein